MPISAGLRLAGMVIVGLALGLGVASVFPVPRVYCPDCNTDSLTITLTETSPTTSTQTVLSSTTVTSTQRLTDTIESTDTLTITSTQTVSTTLSVTSTQTLTSTTTTTVTRLGTGNILVSYSATGDANSPPFTATTTSVQLRLNVTATAAAVSAPKVYWYIYEVGVSSGTCNGDVQEAEGSFVDYCYNLTLGKNYYVSIHAANANTDVVLYELT